MDCMGFHRSVHFSQMTAVFVEHVIQMKLQIRLLPKYQYLVQSVY